MNMVTTTEALQSKAIQQSTSLRLIRKNEVLHLTGLTSSSLYRLIDLGDFPASIQLSERAVAWKSLDVKNWIDSRIFLSEKA